MPLGNTNKLNKCNLDKSAVTLKLCSLPSSWQVVGRRRTRFSAELSLPCNGTSNTSGFILGDHACRPKLLLGSPVTPMPKRSIQRRRVAVHNILLHVGWSCQHIATISSLSDASGNGLCHQAKQGLLLRFRSEPI